MYNLVIGSSAEEDNTLCCATFLTDHLTRHCHTAKQSKQCQAQSTMMWKLDTMTLQLRKALASLNSEVKASRFLSSKIERQMSEASHAF